MGTRIGALSQARKSAAGIVAVVGMLVAAAQARAADPDAEFEKRIARIHAQSVFADMHSHPSQFNRSSVPKLEPEQIEQYARGRYDIIVAAAPPDTVMRGQYVDKDGKFVPQGQYKPAPGQMYDYVNDRMERLLRTVRDGDAALADSPQAVLAARKQGKVSVLMALEGAEALEGDLSRVQALYDKGVRLIQLIHFFPSGLGSPQVFPYTPTGLTDFGRKVIAECNRLGIVVDMAHANMPGLHEALQLSTKPIIVSHTASRAMWAGADRKLIDRSIEDGDLKAIAEKGGVIGVWAGRSSYPSLKEMVDDIDYLVRLVGEDHVGIGTDLWGMGPLGYPEGFGRNGGDFVALERELLSRGYSDERVGKILGGNFFRVWSEVSRVP